MVSLASKLLVQFLLFVFIDPHYVDGVILVQVKERLDLVFKEAGIASCGKKDEAVVGAAFATYSLCPVPLIS